MVWAKELSVYSISLAENKAGFLPSTFDLTFRGEITLTLASPWGIVPLSLMLNIADEHYN